MLKNSEACERNKQPILDILKTTLRKSKTVLEVGSGTGQHITYFARSLPYITWYPSDLKVNLHTLQERLITQKSTNLKQPIELDVRFSQWPVDAVDAIYSANTLHIMSWEHVLHFFRGVEAVLNREGLLIIYGPFRYNNSFTSSSNQSFDLWLKERDSKSGIRDFEAVEALGKRHGLVVVNDYCMPANNQLLVWKKI